MKTIFAIASMMLSVLFLTSCSFDDYNQDAEDKVEVTTLYVSAETGFYYPLFSEGVPCEGMQIKEKGKDYWWCVPFATIKGFTYEKGHAYELLVRKTTLAYPPQDDSNVRYELLIMIKEQSSGKNCGTN